MTDEEELCIPREWLEEFNAVMRSELRGNIQTHEDAFMKFQRRCVDHIALSDEELATPDIVQDWQIGSRVESFLDGEYTTNEINVILKRFTAFATRVVGWNPTKEDDKGEDRRR